MTQRSVTTAIPDPGALSRALAESNDFRAIMIVLIVVIAMLIGFIIWREFNLIRMAKAFETASEKNAVAVEKMTEKLAASVEKTANAMWAIRLTMAGGHFDEPPKQDAP